MADTISAIPRKAGEERRQVDFLRDAPKYYRNSSDDNNSTLSAEERLASLDIAQPHPALEKCKSPTASIKTRKGRYLERSENQSMKSNSNWVVSHLHESCPDSVLEYEHACFIVKGNFRCLAKKKEDDTFRSGVYRDTEAQYTKSVFAQGIQHLLYTQRLSS